eukprot:m.25304 g.25304  ORF g.25304 m.25304 type:complete len:61 (-) comp9827_c0_seq1:172-354(-)
MSEFVCQQPKPHHAVPAVLAKQVYFEKADKKKERKNRHAKSFGFAASFTTLNVRQQYQVW